MGGFEDGTRVYEESLALYQRLGGEIGVGFLLHRVANSELLLHGDTARARSLVEESRDLLGRTGPSKSEVYALGTLGEVEIAEGNYERGLELLQESAAQADTIGYSWWKAVTSSGIAEHLIELDRLEEAERPARDALVAPGEVVTTAGTLLAGGRVAGPAGGVAGGGLRLPLWLPLGLAPGGDGLALPLALRPAGADHGAAGRRRLALPAARAVATPRLEQPAAAVGGRGGEREPGREPLSGIALVAREPCRLAAAPVGRRHILARVSCRAPRTGSVSGLC